MDYLLDYFDLYQLNRKYIVGDQGIMDQNLKPSITERM